VLEGGWPASPDRIGLRFVEMQDQTAVFQVGSGQYRFVSKMPPP